MKSRRRIAAPEAQSLCGLRFGIDGNYSRDLRPAEWGPIIILRGNNPLERMSALGQKQTWQPVGAMSALPPKADIDRSPHNDSEIAAGEPDAQTHWAGPIHQFTTSAGRSPTQRNLQNVAHPVAQTRKS